MLYAPYADLLWCETSEPNIDEARRFAEAIHERFPGKMLAYNCSPSFNWRGKLDTRDHRQFQRELGAMGYKFQFVTLAGFHALNLSMFELARGYAQRGMSAYAELQEREFDLADRFGYAAVRHQPFVGTGYFDEVSKTIAGGLSSDGAERFDGRRAVRKQLLVDRCRGARTPACRVDTFQKPILHAVCDITN